MQSAVRLAFVILTIAVGCSQQGADTAGAPGVWKPRKPISIICPWAAGGGTDRVSRAMAEGLQKELGKPCLVVNKTGGSGASGHEAGAKAKPDGHTLTMITFELSTMHHMGISKLSYQDFCPVVQINADPAAIVVRADSPWQTLPDFLDDIRTRPGKIKMSGTATGGAWDLARAGLLRAADLPVESVVWIPNKGAAPSIVELLGGHIEAVCCSVPEVISQLESKQLRVLAVMAEQRLEHFPDYPTAREQGTDWVAIGWRGLALPKDTPPHIVDAIAAACHKAIESESFRAQMDKFGFGLVIRWEEDFTAFLREQDQLWQPVIEAAGYSQS